MMELLAHLPPWERMLLQDLVFLMPEDDTRTFMCHAQRFGASDGSAPTERGSFSWIISNSSGDRLARCSGPVFGHAISSYHAKAYGLLSLLSFMYHMVQLHKKPVNRIHAPHFVCDTKSLYQHSH